MLWAGPTVLAMVLAVSSHTSAATVKQKISYEVNDCEAISEEDQEDMGFEYLADETEDPCKVAVTLKPRTPKRSLILQRYDEEKKQWADVGRATSNAKGLASIKVPDTFDKDCLNYETFKFRIISKKSGTYAAITSSSFTVGFASDPQSEPCIAAAEEDDGTSAEPED
jgi:hypothetical protein